MWLGDDLKLNLRFESFVNLKGCKTASNVIVNTGLFESFVNLKGCKTMQILQGHLKSLRALLI